MAALPQYRNIVPPALTSFQWCGFLPADGMWGRVFGGFWGIQVIYVSGGYVWIQFAFVIFTVFEVSTCPYRYFFLMGGDLLH